MTYVYVYQDWDILKEEKKLAESHVKRQSQQQVERPSFGLLLQESRIKKRMTTIDVAAAVDCSAKLISMYENGTEVPTGEVANALRRLFDI